ncbi:luciferase domain-containing protein [Pedobacter frigidisoli]|nr:luciferase family protein [Pedobacter frigidisoli]
MFGFIVKYLNFLKRIPLFALIYDSCLKLLLFLTEPMKLTWFDEIENEVLNWEHTSISLHKFGGTQFNYRKTEIGHLHSNGILDILFTKKTKQRLLDEQKATSHHVFEKSGWISFYVRNEKDVENAIALLKLCYDLKLKAYSQNDIILARV